MVCKIVQFGPRSPGTLTELSERLFHALFTWPGSAMKKSAMMKSGTSPLKHLASRHHEYAVEIAVLRSALEVQAKHIARLQAEQDVRSSFSGRQLNTPPEISPPKRQYHSDD